MSEHKYYVSMTDKFMSGWGKAKDKINKYILECDNYDIALIVAENAHRRSEMKYIHICIHKPSYSSKYYYVSGVNKNTAEAWYLPNAFV